MTNFSMNINSNKMAAFNRPFNNLFEYLLAGYPDAAVCNKVVEEQQQFAAAYGPKIAVQTKPQITVAYFFANEAMEPTIIKWMQRICGAQQNFQVTLNNYSGIPSHSIYLRVQDALPFQQLAKQLKSVDEFIRASACPPAKLVTKPYLRIAETPDEDVYNKAIADYAQKIFHESFMMDELLLLRRQHPSDLKSIHVFRLQPAGSNLFTDVPAMWPELLLMK
jgi:hypothetical protein